MLPKNLQRAHTTVVGVSGDLSSFTPACLRQETTVVEGTKIRIACKPGGPNRKGRVPQDTQNTRGSALQPEEKEMKAQPGPETQVLRHPLARPSKSGTDAAEAGWLMSAPPKPMGASPHSLLRGGENRHISPRSRGKSENAEIPRQMRCHLIVRECPQTLFHT